MSMPISVALGGDKHDNSGEGEDPVDSHGNDNFTDVIAAATSEATAAVAGSDAGSDAEDGDDTNGMPKL